MEKETTTVEHDLADARLGGESGDALADIGGGRSIGTSLATHILVERRGGGDRVAALVIDDLRIDVATRTVDRQARAGAATGLESGTNTARIGPPAMMPVPAGAARR